MSKEICKICNKNESDIAFSFNGPRICCHKCWDTEELNDVKIKMFGAIPMRFMTKDQLLERYPKQ